MGNRFKENEPRNNRNNVTVETEAGNSTKDKYKILLRLDGSLEGVIKAAAEEAGLPVTKYVETSLRARLKSEGYL